MVKTVNNNKITSSIKTNTNLISLFCGRDLVINPNMIMIKPNTSIIFALCFCANFQARSLDVDKLVRYPYHILIFFGLKTFITIPASTKIKPQISNITIPLANHYIMLLTSLSLFHHNSTTNEFPIQIYNRSAIICSYAESFSTTYRFGDDEMGSCILNYSPLIDLFEVEVFCRKSDKKRGNRIFLITLQNIYVTIKGETKMKNDITKELNKFLKGILMAIQAYDNYIHHIKDHKLKQIFQQIQQNHKYHATLIAERIQNLDGIPVNEVGFMGNMAQFMSKKTIEVEHIVKDALTGEQRGIEKSKQILNGDLDDESLSLVETILATDEKHIALLSKYIM